MKVQIYSAGFVHCSVCAPKELTAEEIEQEVNAMSPAGISNGWKIDDAQSFAGGLPNPTACEKDATRMHYLMVC